MRVSSALLTALLADGRLGQVARTELKSLLVLVNYGADLNQTDELLCTPLHHAARNGHTKTFEWLDENNADLVKRNLFGQSPADMALANDFPDLADQIVRAGKLLLQRISSELSI
ncbi:uncharacterized protein DEA37_0004188 [Paragonimus westermani]|uniref:Uncharacterized protein n=1 Tax=Paragonimus westermani TaxID=34504 RepID=A0A5J4NCY6_9TREM|nr:uncharacterized protein DEA37_0004188 [Paragonimus westermani]